VDAVPCTWESGRTFQIFLTKQNEEGQEVKFSFDFRKQIQDRRTQLQRNSVQIEELLKFEKEWE
jgi:hypothetical protein